MNRKYWISELIKIQNSEKYKDQDILTFTAFLNDEELEQYVKQRQVNELSLEDSQKTSIMTSIQKGLLNDNLKSIIDSIKKIDLKIDLLNMEKKSFLEYFERYISFLKKDLN